MKSDQNIDELVAGDTGSGRGRPAHRWRIAAWSAVVVLLLVPLVAMQFTEEVNWGLGDFVFAAVLFSGTLLAFELAAKTTTNIAYRAAAGVALAAALILIWVNLAVGLIGSEDNPANAMYFGVLAVGMFGAIIARFQPHGMTRALFATALAQALVAVIALIGGLGAPENRPLEIVAANGFFLALFVLSAWLFRRAAQGQIRGHA